MLSKRSDHIKGVLTFLSLALFFSGCQTQQQGDQTPPQQRAQQVQPPTPSEEQTYRLRGDSPNSNLAQTFSIISAGEKVKTAPLYQQGNRIWVPVHELSQSIGMKTSWSAESRNIQIGDTDAVFQMQIGKRQARSGDRSVQLEQEPIMIEGRPFVTKDSWESLTGTQLRVDGRGRTLDLTVPEQGLSQGAGIRATATPQIDEQALLQFGLKFKGVPYRFSAEPYPESKRFDCSSFTQYVFGKFGVRLPRSSRAQSQTGVRIGKKEMKPGDLMFFFTPGRYESNRIVGHVGIYMGQDKILHTYGRPGVTVSKFSGYWEKRFLFAKRVAR